jgi:recombination protein RecA
VLDLAVEAGIVDKSGSWFSFQGERIGQGREKVRAFLDENPELVDKIASLVLDKHGLGKRAGGNGQGKPAATEDTTEDSAASPPARR